MNNRYSIKITNYKAKSAVLGQQSQITNNIPPTIVQHFKKMFNANTE